MALISHYINEGVPPIETLQCGVLLSYGLARLDGKAERKPMDKLKAYDRMCDPGRTPIINSHVHACDPREPDRARFPVRREIALCAVVAIPHVVDGDLIAIDLGPRCLRNIRCPWPIVAGF